jgi:hypothetical protein
MAEEVWDGFSIAVLLFVFIAGAIVVYWTLSSLRKSKWSLCVLAILFGFTTIYITSIVTNPGPLPPFVIGLMCGLVPLITIGPFLAVFFGEESIIGWEKDLDLEARIEKAGARARAEPKPKKLSEMSYVERMIHERPELEESRHLLSSHDFQRNVLKYGPLNMKSTRKAMKDFQKRYHPRRGWK